MEPFGAGADDNESKAFIWLAQLELRMKMSERKKREGKKGEKKVHWQALREGLILRQSGNKNGTICLGSEQCLI